MQTLVQALHILYTSLYIHILAGKWEGGRDSHIITSVNSSLSYKLDIRQLLNIANKRMPKK